MHIPSDIWLDSQEDNNNFSFPPTAESPEKLDKENLPKSLPVLPLRNMVLFPGLFMPITVSRERSIQLVKKVYDTKDHLMCVVTQKDSDEEHPGFDDVYKVGTVARILKLIRMPEGSVTIIIQGTTRVKIESFLEETPYFIAEISLFPDTEAVHDKSKAMFRTIKQLANDVIDLSPNIPKEAHLAINNIRYLNFLIHFVASNLPVDVSIKQELLEIEDIMRKGAAVISHLQQEIQLLQLSEEINSRVRNDLEKQQRDYYLRQQIRVIQDELGDESEIGDIERLKKRAASKKWSLEAQAAFERHIGKLARMNPGMPEYTVSTNIIEWMLDLPWQQYTKDRIDLEKAQKILDKDHFGLEQVKKRILEHLAVMKLKGDDSRASILCLYGPPGVGKTSLGKSIAKSLNRKFVRMSLGGVRDEAEIRGHRSTYIGAMPGRILQGLKKAKSGNPVFLLDEIDKVGNDFRGDPASALLEVLDPEQNNSFNDHFLEVDYDLSKVMFICTANSLETIHPALRDRMEIIEINGYSLEEKVEIAKKHLIPSIRAEHGLKEKQARIDIKAIRWLIEHYTRESGVRMLKQQISGIFRGIATRIVKDETAEIRVTESMVETFLGIPKFDKEHSEELILPGVSVGLAWTPTGGDILFIESTLIKGNGKLNITGQLGDVMKESATIALTFLKANADLLKISNKVFDHWDLHLHVPAGAIPKDGPSAGIAMLSAFASLFTQRLVRSNLAMSGEITLRGKVLPVGGIKEKLLAAVRANIREVILCHENRKDVSEINPEYLQGLNVHYVNTMLEVFDLALEKSEVKQPRILLPNEISPEMLTNPAARA
ncbi:MAG: endopeptidase La [Bacteroidia bacterium]|nr:endopeptidase La [Bacteroidia bacterium]